MGLIIITAPASEPLTLQEAKDHLRFTDSSEDTLISALIVAARQHIENLTGRALITQTLELQLDGFPATRKILLPSSPVQSVSSVKYYDTDGALQTWSSTEYQVVTSQIVPVIAPASGYDWPETDTDTLASVQVRYIAGFGNAAAIPEPIKQAMRLLIGHLFTNRESVVVGTISQIVPKTVEHLISPYRVVYGA